MKKVMKLTVLVFLLVGTVMLVSTVMAQTTCPQRLCTIPTNNVDCVAYNCGDCTFSEGAYHCTNKSSEAVPELKLTGIMAFIIAIAVAGFFLLKKK